MKSFSKFINEGSGRKEYLEKKEIEAARQKLKNTPELSPDQMRAQNPGPTAAYEKDAAERRGRTVTVDTPEGQITAGGASKSGKIPFQTSGGKTEYITPDEAISRAETQAKKGPKKKIVKRSITPKSSTSSAAKPTSVSTPEVKPVKVDLSKYKAPEVKLGSLKPVSAKATPKATPQASAKPSVTAATRAAEREAAKTTGRAARSAARGAAATKVLGNVGKIAGVVGAGLEAKAGYDAARAAGASKRRAAGAGAAAALGGLAGGALGGAAGGVLGVPGAVGGGIAGYTAGTKAGEYLYKKLTGDPTKKLTTKDVQSNIRKIVPYSVRSAVPADARKTFSKFVTDAGRAYGNWSRSQGKGGNK